MISLLRRRESRWGMIQVDAAVQSSEGLGRSIVGRGAARRHPQHGRGLRHRRPAAVCGTCAPKSCVTNAYVSLFVLSPTPVNIGTTYAVTCSELDLASNGSRSALPRKVYSAFAPFLPLFPFAPSTRSRVRAVYWSSCPFLAATESLLRLRPFRLHACVDIYSTGTRACRCLPELTTCSARFTNVW
jgi:hypothetical protein